MSNMQPHQLIVDFSPQLRVSNRSAKKAQSVRFSDFSSMAIYKVTGDRESKYYSSKDKRGFEIDMLQSARRMAQMIASPLPLNADAVIECIGIEKILSVDRARSAIQHKEDHARLIISSQDTCSAEELSRISQESSKLTGKVAQKLASAYGNLKV